MSKNNSPCKAPHPTQPVYRDKLGTIRFKPNRIIEYLFDAGLLDLNAIGAMDFSKEDHSQIAQLLGYSVSGYGDLSYVTRKSVVQAYEFCGGFAMSGGLASHTQEGTEQPKLEHGWDGPKCVIGWVEFNTCSVCGCDPSDTDYQECPGKWVYGERL